MVAPALTLLASGTTLLLLLAALRRQRCSWRHCSIFPLSPTLLTLMAWTLTTPAPMMRPSNITLTPWSIATDLLYHTHTALVWPIDALPLRLDRTHCAALR